MKIVYSHNKRGVEALAWQRELAAASNDEHTFIPFNHGEYVDPLACEDSVMLDRLYQNGAPSLRNLHGALSSVLRDAGADALLVTNAAPYHPDFLRGLDVYKALYSTDDPGATYQRTIPYIHAYDHIFHCAPGYSADMDLGEKLQYAGAKRVDFLPLGVFDFEFDSRKSEAELSRQERDIDVIYIGSFFRQKLDVLAYLRRRLGRRLKVHGYFRLKHNLFLNVRYGFGSWIRPVSFEDRVRLYQRAAIGFNLHWNSFGFGNQRLYHLPANGVLQISDCPALHHRVFDPGSEILGFEAAEQLVELIDRYLNSPEDRMNIALRAYRRTMAQYRIRDVTRLAAGLMARSAA